MSRDFRLYWSAEVTSTFGSAFTATATSVIAIETFGASAIEVGFLTAASFLPSMVFGLIAGAFADRVHRPRQVLVWCDAIAACTVLSVVAGIWSGLATIWWLVALNMVLGVLGTVITPLYFTHLGRLVGADDVLTGRARLQAGEYGATVLGRSAAGPVLAIASGPAAFLIDAATYVVSIVCLRSLRTPDRAAEPQEPADRTNSLVSDIAAGMRELMSRRFVRAIIAFLIAWSLVFAAVSALTPTFLLRTLEFPVGIYGVLFAFTGVAGLAGSLLGGYLSRRVSLPVLTIGGFGGAIVTTTLLPMASGPVPVAAAVGLLALALPAMFGAIANIGLTGVVTRDIPEDVLGRAIAALRTGTTCAQVLGAALGGALGDVLGIRPALWLFCSAGAACLLLVVPAARTAGKAAVARERVEV